MKTKLLTLLFLFTLSSVSALSQTSWLDRSISANWNNGTGIIPTAPRESASTPNSEMCRSQIRPSDSLADRAVTRAGWFLYGPSYTYGTITIVTAMASVDGMCRPNQYNGFVFVSNRFAGTLSPVASDARSDGAMSRINFFSPDNVYVEFSRYSEDDALCCPSRTSTVSYSITTGPRGLVKAEDIDTRAICEGSGPIQTQDNVVSGTVTYRMQTRVLPPTAILTVSLLDVSRADAPSLPIAQQRIETAGKLVPFAFDMAYDRTKIQERNRYAVRAEIRDGDRLLFTTDTNYPVITQNNPRNVEITLVPVGGGVGVGGNRESVIRGTVTYRQRIALTPNSEIKVRLVDSADPDGTPVAETTVNSASRNVPIPFELSYALRDINRQRTYELQAEIRTNGELRFKTDAGQPVTLRGGQTPALELVVVPASDGPVAITGRTLSLSKFGTGSMQIEGRNSMFLVRGSVTVRDTGDADVTLSRIDGSITFSGKLTFIDDTTARITVDSSGEADASGEIQITYSGRSLRNITATNLVLDGQNVTLRF